MPRTGKVGAAVTADEAAELARICALNAIAAVKSVIGDLDQVVERASESLHQFTVAMAHVNELLKSANKVVGDPEAQQALHDTLVAMPKLVKETHGTIAETRSAVASSRLVLESVKTMMDKEIHALSMRCLPSGS